MATPKYTIEKMSAALTDAKGLVHVTAQRLGCTPQTVYNYIKKHETVRIALENAREYMVDAAELKFFDAINRGESWAIAMMLKTRGRNRGYIERQERETTVRLTLEEAAQLSDAELLTLLEEPP